MLSAMLKELKRERLIGIEDAAVLRKDEGGKLHIGQKDVDGDQEWRRFC